MGSLVDFFIFYFYPSEEEGGVQEVGRAVCVASSKDEKSSVWWLQRRWEEQCGWGAVRLVRAVGTRKAVRLESNGFGVIY